MAIRVKIPVFDRRVAFEGNGAFSKETIAREFSRLASKDIARIDRENAEAIGYKLPHTTRVDGIATTPLPDSVEAGHVISARWEVGIGAVSYAWESLTKLPRPYRKGDYRRSHRMYADGREISHPEEAVGAREVIILSIVPYARKIERGKKGYAPGAVYQAVAALTAARYGNAATVKFSYAEPPGPAAPLDAWAATSMTAAMQRKKKGRDNPRRQPAILIFLT